MVPNGHSLIQINHEERRDPFLDATMFRFDLGCSRTVIRFFRVE
jgi:hypothetical protein